MCVADKGCVVHKELWFYLMYYSRDIMKRNTPNDMNAARIVSITYRCSIQVIEATAFLFPPVAATHKVKVSLIVPIPLLPI
jgi:hypothetical protein